MITLTYNSVSGYWLVKSEIGDILFASQDQFAAGDYIVMLELEASESYQNWLMEQDAKFMENV